MPPLTSQEYVDEIQFLSRDPDPNTPLSKCLSGFARWIGQEHYPPGTEKPDQFMSKSGQPHNLVVVHTSGDDGWGVQRFSQGEVSSFTSDVRAGPDDSAGQKQVILVRGFMSPAWVAAIGSKFDVDPEFFRRHLDFLPGETYNEDPLIGSPSKCGMYRLCLSSIYETGNPDDGRNGTDTDTDMNARRENQTAELKAYKERLGSTDVWCGASIVRDYSVLCPRYSVMEQYVSICVKESENDDCWTAIIWTDQGLPFTKSPLGPWPAADHHFLHPPPVMEWTASYSHSSPQATGKHKNLTATISPSSPPLTPNPGIGPLQACTPFFEQAAYSSEKLQRTLGYRISDAKSRTARANSAAETLTITTGLDTFRHTTGILRRHGSQFLMAITLALRNAGSNNNGDYRFDLASVLRRDVDSDPESESESAIIYIDARNQKPSTTSCRNTTISMTPTKT